MSSSPIPMRKHAGSSRPPSNSSPIYSAAHPAGFSHPLTISKPTGRRLRSCRRRTAWRRSLCGAVMKDLIQDVAEYAHGFSIRSFWSRRRCDEQRSATCPQLATRIGVRCSLDKRPPDNPSVRWRPTPVARRLCSGVLSRFGKATAEFREHRRPSAAVTAPPTLVRAFGEYTFNEPARSYSFVGAKRTKLQQRPATMTSIPMDATAESCCAVWRIPASFAIDTERATPCPRRF